MKIRGTDRVMGKMRKIGKELGEKHVLAEENIATIIMHAHRRRARLHLHTNTHLKRGFIKHHKQCHLQFTTRIEKKC